LTSISHNPAGTPPPFPPNGDDGQRNGLPTGTQRASPAAGERRPRDSRKRLHEHHGQVATEICLLKLAEEVGEAAEALIRMRGNKRKGCAAPATTCSTN
jgi:hypothetical protein